MRVKISVALLVSTCAVALGPSARAEDFPFETGASASASATKEDEMTKGFGQDTGISDAEKSGTESEKLQLGGSLWSEFFYFEDTSPSGGSGYFLNPNTLYVYMDSRLRKEVRVFAKGRAVYNLAGSPGAGSSLLAGAQYATSSTNLDELKIQFPVARKVFFTVGRQKIKWGSARFWNPTDVVNSLKRDVLYSEDRRLGVTLVKTHVPIGRANAYLIQSLDGASRVNEVGHALRFELPLESSELALSAASRHGRKPVFGADVSTALGDFDVYAEAAYSRSSSKTYYRGPFLPTAYAKPDPVTNWTGGVSYDWKYSDTDMASFGVEYYSNAEGYASKDDYLWVFSGGGYRPYELGRGYGMLFASLPKPGSWNDVSFMLLNLANLTDKSAILRLSATITSLQDLVFDLGVNAHYGNNAGEFMLGGQRWDAYGRMSVSF